MQETEQSRSAPLQVLNATCLRLCIALLNHCLMEDIFDSVVIKFLAVARIDQTTDDSLEAPASTNKLDAFIKIALSYVIQQTVLAVETNDIEYPSQMLDQLQDHFLVYRSCSPVN
jgi:hypothetical protein